MWQKAWDYYNNFLSWDIEKQNQELINRPSAYWEKAGERKALEVFHAAAVRVPAYKDFLSKHNINHNKIKTIHDFQSVPLIDKKNYLRAYPLKDLCWDGDLTKMNVVSVSSGSSGQPFFWPRDIRQELEVDHLYELTLKYLFQADKKHSLVIIAFAIGMYIAGPFTFASILRQGQKGYPISLTTPSNDIEAVLKVVSNLGGQFDQVIIGGYPPLVRDIIDTGKQAGIDWKKHNTKLFFGGEGFSEAWRDYVHFNIGAHKTLSTTINMYGTADAALLGIETPTSIAFRRLASSTDENLEHYFKSGRVPSVVTYNPLLKYFETVGDGKLLFTSSSGVPLIRYDIGDVGGILPYQTVNHAFTEQGQRLSHLLKHDGQQDWKLPLVYLFGRDDFTVQLYGANVYPENIKEALEDRRISQIVSGKFIIHTQYRHDMSPYLDLKVELAQNTNPDGIQKALIQKVIVEKLRKRNAEYNVIYKTIKNKAAPLVTLVKFGNSDFKINIKHRWVKKAK